MLKKILIFYAIVSTIVIVLLLIFYRKPQTENNTQIDLVEQKIEYYSNNYFRFLEDIDISTDATGKTVSISFVPEIASYPIKEEIYQNVAYHALQISEFFTEVTHFEYRLLWGASNEEVMILSIDKNAISDLLDTYYGEYGNQHSGLETSFKNAFSTITETDVSRSWRNNIDFDSYTP